MKSFCGCFSQGGSDLRSRPHCSSHSRPWHRCRKALERPEVVWQGTGGRMSIEGTWAGIDFLWVHLLIFLVRNMVLLWQQVFFNFKVFQLLWLWHLKGWACEWSTFHVLGRRAKPATWFASNLNTLPGPIFCTAHNGHSPYSLVIALNFEEMLVCDGHWFSCLLSGVTCVDHVLALAFQ